MSASEKICGYEVHPLARKFPLMDPAELAALEASIKGLGFNPNDAIVLLDGKILDGRNRGIACERTGVPPIVRQATAEEAARPLAHVVAWNMDRRHLNPSQRALLAAELLPELEREARARQLAPLNRGKVAAPSGVPTRDPSLDICGCTHHLGQHSKKGCSKCTCELFEPAAACPSPPVGGNDEEKAALGMTRWVREARKAAGTAAAAAAATVGASERTVQRAKFVLQEAPGHLVKRVREGKATLKQAETEIRKEEQLKAIRVYRPPEGEYAVISIDFPWKYEDELNGSDSMRGGCPYPPMTIAEGCKLKVPAAKDCVLFLWITNAQLVAGEHLPLLAAWGFKVPPAKNPAAKTMMTWAKPRFGTGHWLRGQTEHAILAIRGRPVVTLTNQSTLLVAPMGRMHSEKPAEFYQLVESLCPGRPRLEMFARAPREGWTTTGAELPASKATVDASPAPAKRTKPERAAKGGPRKKLAVYSWWRRPKGKRVHAFGGPLVDPTVAACGRYMKRGQVHVRAKNKGLKCCSSCIGAVDADVRNGNARDEMADLWRRAVQVVGSPKAARAKHPEWVWWKRRGVGASAHAFGGGNSSLVAACRVVERASGKGWSEVRAGETPKRCGGCLDELDPFRGTAGPVVTRQSVGRRKHQGQPRAAGGGTKR